jgi:hypothetical protein
LAISIPLRNAQCFTWLYNSMQTSIGLASVVIGGMLVYQFGNV